MHSIDIITIINDCYVFELRPDKTRSNRFWSIVYYALYHIKTWRESTFHMVFPEKKTLYNQLLIKDLSSPKRLTIYFLIFSTHYTLISTKCFRDAQLTMTISRTVAFSTFFYLLYRYLWQRCSNFNVPALQSPTI